MAHVDIAAIHVEDNYSTFDDLRLGRSNQQGIGGVDEKELPSCIQEIIGREFVFQLKVTPFNFTPKHRTFTISTINPKTSEPAPFVEGEATTNVPMENEKTDEAATSKGTPVEANCKRPRE